MNLIPALKIKQICLKREIKAINVQIQKLLKNEYNERRWRLRNDRPAGAEDKRRMKEITIKRDKLYKERYALQIKVWNYGDAICRLREIKRGNSKRDVGSVIKQLIIGMSK